jgi:MFS family permease
MGNSDAPAREARVVTGINLVFRSLRHRNFRLFFLGQGVSLIGTWMQQTAMSWLVYRLTGSPFLLGLVGFSSQIPVFFLAPVAGFAADRWNRHRILVATQSLALLQALALSALAFTGSLTIGHIIPLSVIMGLINAVDMPVRQAFVVEMVERREELGNAIALNSSLFNSARLIGPSIAGLVVSSAGEGICFLINALSFIAVIAALLSMKLKPRERAADGSGVFESVREGFSYAFRSPPIRKVLIMLALVSLIGIPFLVLMPVIARDVLGGGADTLGFLMGAAGLGALCGAVTLAMRKGIRGLGRWIPLAASIFGAGLVAVSFSRTLWASLFLVAVAGFGMMVQIASSNTLMQSVADDDKRGRVMSLYTMSLVGLAPLGSLILGSIAGKIGAPNTLFASGVACIVAAYVVMGRKPRRQGGA